MNRRWIDPQDFCDLRKHFGLSRAQAAEALDVTPPAAVAFPAAVAHSQKFRIYKFN